MKVALVCVLMCVAGVACAMPTIDGERRQLLQQAPKPATPSAPAKAAPATAAAAAGTPKPATTAPKAPGNATAPVKGKPAGAKQNSTAGQGGRANFDLGDAAAFGEAYATPKAPRAPRDPSLSWAGRKLLMALVGSVGPAGNRRQLLQQAAQAPKPATPTAPAKAAPTAGAPKAPRNATAPVKGKPAGPAGAKQNSTAGQGGRVNFDMGDAATFGEGYATPRAPRRPGSVASLSEPNRSWVGRKLLLALVGSVGPAGNRQ